MSQEKNNKVWWDAVREQCFPDEAAPSPGGWAQVGRKMRRAAARRRAGLTAAVAVPVIAMLVWAPWRQTESMPAGEGVPLLAESPVAPERVPVFLGGDEETSTAVRRLSGRAVESSAPKPVLPPSEPDKTEEENLDTPSNDTRKEDENQSDSSEILQVRTDSDPGMSEPRFRPHISVILRAGAGMERRNTEVQMQAAPYIAALTYLNTVNPGRTPQVKSNFNNTRELGVLANTLFPEASSGQYTHDLPLSFGLSLRMALTPRLGIESGLEYTCLHSVEVFAGNRMDQWLHFLGVPLRADVHLLSFHAFDVYAGLGGKVEKCVSAHLGRVECEEPRLQWSAETFVGIQYQAWPRTHVYFQPELSCYLTQTDLITYRTEHPLSLSLLAGLRFDL